MSIAELLMGQDLEVFVINKQAGIGICVLV